MMYVQKYLKSMCRLILHVFRKLSVMNFEKAPNTSYKPQIGHKKEKLYEIFAAHNKCESIKSFEMLGMRS
jgi:hypothetical protein